jgi:hypothetical protein
VDFNCIFVLQVEAIAHALGLQRVGWIFTHPTRDYAVASNELRQMARFQVIFTQGKGNKLMFCVL